MLSRSEEVLTGFSVQPWHEDADTGPRTPVSGAEAAPSRPSPTDGETPRAIVRAGGHRKAVFCSVCFSSEKVDG